MQAPALGTLTAEAVEARIPLLVRIARDSIDTFEARRELRNRRRSAGRGVESGRDPEDSNSPSSEELALRDEERRLSQALLALEREVEQLGGTLVAAESGTIEFPSILGTRLVLLSWRPGDERVSHYRDLDSPSEERRTLPGIENAEPEEPPGAETSD